MHQATFDLFRKLIHEAGGISLGDDKATLLRTRIRGRLIKLKIDTPEKYLKHIRSDDSGQELTHLIDSIATNYTFFFREEDHFETLKKRVRELLSQGKKRIRIWSAACSSGEEPYCIAMVVRAVLNEMNIKAEHVDIKVLATDISTKILRKAIQGNYRKNQISRVPPEWQNLYFNQINTAEGKLYQVSQTLKDMVTFRHLNLNAPTLPMKGPFDAIFCRNVMIYFDEPTRKTLVHKFNKVMSVGSPLFVGMTESIMGYCDQLPYSEPSVYCKTNSKSLATAK